VALKSAEQSETRKATNAACPMPPIMVSKEVASANSQIFLPTNASHTYSRFVRACPMPKISNDRNVPHRM
jgi:hypothetical protein